MSSSRLDTSGVESTRKRSTSPIRNYFSPISSATQPLVSPNDNVRQDRSSTTKVTTKKTTIASGHSIQKKGTLLDLFEKGARKSHKALKVLDCLTATTSSKDTPIKTKEQRPSLKRSHSAISSVDNEGWMKKLINVPKTIHKEPYDRLTPSITDMSSAQVLMFSQSSSSTTSSSQPLQDTYTTNGESYQEQIAKACGLDSTRRILSYTAKPPKKSTVDLRTSTTPDLNTHTTPEFKRRIRSSPEKILDAPYMEDDYYLNVLDWSCRNVVAVGLGKSVYLWNADNGSIKALNYQLDELVTSLSWSKDGHYLALGTTSGDTQLWDTEKNTKLRSMKGQDCRVGVLSWDNHLVSSGGKDGSIWHHDVRLPKHNVMELYGHVDEVCGLKWRWDGQLLASGGNDNTVNIWDARSTTAKYQKRTHTGAIKALAWCPWNHNNLATGGGRDDKNIHFWNTTTGVKLNTIHAGSQITSLHWSSHFKEITSTHGYPNNQVTVWGYPSLNKIIDIPAHESRILHATLSPDGQILATAAADENLKFWRIFEHNGKSPLLGRDAAKAEKKQGVLQRSKSIR